MSWPRVAFDAEAHLRETSGTRSCFICRLVESMEHSREVVHRDGHHIVFLNRYPTLEGYVLVAPLEHREQVVGDFSLDEYLELQSLLYRVGRAMSAVVATERIYLLSLGSQQANRHVHWHVAALPPGTPLSDQQFAALMPEHRGYLDIPEVERDLFAAHLRDAMRDLDPR